MKMLHEGETPDEPKYINWERYVNELPFVTPLNFNTNQVSHVTLDTGAMRVTSQSQPQSEINLDDLLS
jgi:hypothetical protein